MQYHHTIAFKNRRSSIKRRCCLLECSFALIIGADLHVCVCVCRLCARAKQMRVSRCADVCKFRMYVNPHCALVCSKRTRLSLSPWLTTVQGNWRQYYKYFCEFLISFWRYDVIPVALFSSSLSNMYCFCVSHTFHRNFDVCTKIETGLCT